VVTVWSTGRTIECPLNHGGRSPSIAWIESQRDRWKGPLRLVRRLLQERKERRWRIRAPVSIEIERTFDARPRRCSTPGQREGHAAVVPRRR